MSFLISTFQRSQSLRIAGILPKLKPSFTSPNNSIDFQKYVVSPEEASLTAKFNEINLNNSVFKFQSFPTSTSLRLPTLDENKGITYHIPVNKPRIEDIPAFNIVELFDPLSSIVIEEPASPEQSIRKEAIRMIVIRRKKMKTHKLKKLRKRMKYVFQKTSQKREFKKEKIFQASQMDLIRAAHAFNPEEHVRNIIAKTREVPFPTRWKGKRLPKEVIMNILANNGKYVLPK